MCAATAAAEPLEDPPGVLVLSCGFVVFPGSKYAIQARLDIAFNLLKQKKYNRAIIELDQFIEKYPNIPATPYAYYLQGVVAEKKSIMIS